MAGEAATGTGNSGVGRFEDAGVRLALDGELATVTLSRPERRNAQTPTLWQALRDVGDLLQEGQVRVVVVGGDGPSFSAGLDVRMLRPEGVPGEGSLAGLAQLDDDALEAFVSRAQRAFTWLRDPGLVSVAAVHGHAVGAGWQLALACDLRVLADDALLAMREPAMGLVPDLGGTKPLVDAVGYARAAEICLTGRWVEAAEARQLGLAEIVVAARDLDATVRDLAAALLATPAHAAAETKALLANAVHGSFADQLAAERQAQLRCLRGLAGERPAPAASEGGAG